MNPSDKYEQIKDIKRLNPVELEAMVLCHEQQIKDIAAHLLELKMLVETKQPLTQAQMDALCNAYLCYQEESPELSGIYKLIREVERAHGIGEKSNE